MKTKKFKMSEPRVLSDEEMNELNLIHQAGDGCANAQYDLAMLYIEQSANAEYIPFKAKKLLRNSALQGHADAIEKLKTVKDQKYPWWA